MAAGEPARVETRRASEVRADGRRLSGVVMPWGAVARPPAVAVPERFERGAFGDLAAADVTLTWQHDRSAPLARTGGGGLTLADSPEALRMAAELPDTVAGGDAATLVAAGVMRGLSVEFCALQERLEGGVRVIQRAVLLRVGLVDTPAYVGSIVEARQDGQAAAVEDAAALGAGAALILIQGPAGSGKTGVTRAMRRAGVVDVVADLTGIWAALTLAERDAGGMLPIRRAEDPAVVVAAHARKVAARRALDEGLRVVVTVSAPDREAEWREVADRAGARFRARTIDPGEDVVRSRLARQGEAGLSDECEKAVRRWYGRSGMRPRRRPQRRRAWL